MVFFGFIPLSLGAKLELYFDHEIGHKFARLACLW